MVEAGHAVFRADASPSTGAGHLVRCGALAAELGTRGWRCTLAGTAGTSAIAAKLGLEAWDVVTLEADEGVAEADALADSLPGGCDLLVTDHYGRDATFEAACRPWARRILAIDDLADRRHDCELLLDPTPGRSAADYTGLLPDGCRVLAGPAYALLRPEFHQARLGLGGDEGEVARERPAGRVLVSLGATDPDNLTEAVLHGIGASGLNPTVDVVLSSSAPYLASVERRAAAMNPPATHHVDVRSMAPLMAAAELAIGAGGSSAWERCCLYLPSLILVTADNQRDGAAALARAKAAIVVDAGSGDVGGAVADLLVRLGGEATEWAAMARAAGGLCDGLGAARAAAALADQPTARNGGPVTLRPAGLKDSEIMLAWQRHKETRRFARNPEPPEPAAHQAWLEEKLSDPRCLLQIIEYDGAPAGVLRLDYQPKHEAHEISILIEPARHGHGIGGAALAALRFLLPRAAFRANVLPGNEASAALFERAGYREQEPGWWLSEPETHEAPTLSRGVT